MPKTKLIARQSRQPQGLLGEIVACAMAYDTANVNRAVLDRLALEPGDAVLELGFGAGRALTQVGARIRDGFVAGLDPSEVMLRHARFRNGRFLRRGHMELQLGEAARIPYPEGRFDKAYAVHVLYFWPDAEVELREMHRVLRPGGLLLLGFRPKDDPAVVANAPEPIYKLRTVAEVKALLRETGFRDPSCEVQIDRGRQIAWASGTR